MLVDVIYPDRIVGVQPKKPKSVYLDKIKEQKPSCSENEAEL